MATKRSTYPRRGATRNSPDTILLRWMQALVRFEALYHQLLNYANRPQREPEKMRVGRLKVISASQISALLIDMEQLLGRLSQDMDVAAMAPQLDQQLSKHSLLMTDLSDQAQAVLNQTQA